MVRRGSKRHASVTKRVRAPWLLLFAMLFGHVYGQLHRAESPHHECAQHPGEWQHDEPAQHGQSEGEHDHCSIVKLGSPAAEPVDAEPLFAVIATIPSDPPPMQPAPIAARTPLLRLAPKTSPPTNC